MVVGGWYHARLNIAEVISLDPVNRPVPACLRTIKEFPDKITDSASASINNGIQLASEKSKQEEIAR